MEKKKGVVLVVGAGAGLGGAVARRFARDGYTVCATRQYLERLDGLVAEIEADGGVIHSFGVDARKEEAVIELFEKIETEIGPLEVVVFNIGANIRC